MAEREVWFFSPVAAAFPPDLAFPEVFPDISCFGEGDEINRGVICLCTLARLVSRAPRVTSVISDCHTCNTTQRSFLSTTTPLAPLPHPMAPKPASTAGKAPASTASKAPAKTTSESKGAKKTKAAASGGDADAKKKRRKTRKETYSSYIYKGTSIQLDFDAL